ncbi:copper resistance CopC family protein [Nocardiopsis ansamitocini]|uniref:CopC domain-containing protein n=1 Tax=Nocardiopsis ansamitocini TaxID=1670832 RepID=A0A9W6UKN8_9ACTN|nr:copper resistance CopC family protein [Nocardiopsis ansamitocini]GLU50179.1 hypothetical protein Nans01_45300 [Nocardiopsis ansamitocini]
MQKKKGSADSRRVRRSRALALMLAVPLAVAAVAAVGQAPASAHDRLISSTPGDGAELEDPPAEIVLTFNNTVMDIGAAVTVLDGDSQVVAEGEAEVEGPDVTQTVRAGLPDGGYGVRWRVISSDGHPISGSFTFTLGDHSAAPPALVPQEETGQATDPAPSADASAVDHPSALPRMLTPAVIGAGAGALLYFLAAKTSARRSRTTHPPA